MVSLDRFVNAQTGVYETALAELQAGHKRTHWMWFEFPQIQGLGHSEIARHYAIADATEARAYLAHPILGPRLCECAKMVLNRAESSANDIFGFPDDLKLKSSMTLFAFASSEEDSVFTEVLGKFYEGEQCKFTVQQFDGA